ncbi:MAG: TonB-dependent receptor, partial [Gammaproteobacteria bacterium]
LNQTSQALEDATRAVELAPSAASSIALSYAQQSNLDLESARSTMQQANTDNPENALVLARLAELNLMLGRTRHAVELAQKAVSIDADIDRSQMVLGFAALAQFNHTTASTAFEKAISLNSSNPLSRLGLGLAKITAGDLTAGRKDIEAAVALDSNDAVIRTYLGKSYFEEKRDPLAADQYSIARQLDPDDPTAFMFSALLKHSENRPVEALQDLKTSIELNDNRAVYRGRNLLDQDRAVRGTSLARIYDTLGFSEQGIREATKSLAVDPANDSAHRFLSDSYLHVRRREISRVSELLQAQMLQDINLNPAQPSISATNLNIGSGAGDVGLNEFTGLFERNRVQPAISLLSGSNNTRAGEGVISGVYNSLSFSLGAFKYETDGWRENNGQDQELGNLFVQWAVSSKLNLQAEISSRETTEGDLAFNFDPTDFDSTLTKERDHDTQRFGLRYSPTPDGDLLVSYISSDRTEHQTFSDIVVVPNPAFPPFPPPFLFVPGDIDISRDDDGTQVEAQYIHNFDTFNLVVGLADAEVDSVITLATTPPSLLENKTTSNLSQSRSYLYSIIELPENVDLTLGVSRDKYEEDPTDKTSTNPKFGISWQPNEQQLVRLAAFRVMKPALVNNRTLEPTQVAGFNQFYDDINATISERVGLGYDVKLGRNVALGLEATTRDIEEPTIDVLNNETIFEKREEQNNRIYVNWTPTSSIAVSAEAVYDTYKAESGIATQNDNLPEHVKTKSLPVSFRYFSPTGWYGEITATLVDQEVQRDPSSTQASGEDSFRLLDLSVGYRLPKRLGAVSLAINNATDQKFMYQDDSYREFRDEPSIGPYFPERTVNVQFSLVF